LCSDRRGQGRLAPAPDPPRAQIPPALAKAVISQFLDEVAACILASQPRIDFGGERLKITTF
jgi:hypothetical protein